MTTERTQLHEYFQTKQNDPAALDVIVTFCLSLPSTTGYTKHQGTWKLLVGAVTIRNLRAKYGLRVNDARDYMARFIEFPNSLPASFLSKESYHKDSELLQQTIQHFKRAFEAQLHSRLGLPDTLTETDRQVASFTMSYWPLKALEVEEHEHGFGSAVKELEYAVRGSKYPIEIKVFGAAPPLEQNLKYCPSCGTPNPKNARFCTRCGKEQWL